MKVATLIARTPAGWKNLAIGDVMEVRGLFKELKLLPACPVGKSFAEVVVYFDTGGDIRRKRFDTPTTAKAILAAREAVNALEEKRREEAAARTAQAEGQAKAAQVASKVVEVVRTELASAGSASLASKPAVVVPAPESVTLNGDEGTAASPAPDAQTDPDKHFG